MPKMKTRKALAKRVHVTGTGKLLHIKVGKSHLRRRKSKRVKRALDKKCEFHPADLDKVRKELPYA